MVPLDARIHQLVNEQYAKMTLSAKSSNQARLYNACEHIVYTEWGFLNRVVQDSITTHVNRVIPDYLD